MKTGMLMIALLSLPLSGCIALPDEQPADHITFDAVPPSQATMSYDDVLCCYDCNA